MPEPTQARGRSGRREQARGSEQRGHGVSLGTPYPELAEDWVCQLASPPQTQDASLPKAHPLPIVGMSSHVLPINILPLRFLLTPPH